MAPGSLHDLAHHLVRAGGGIGVVVIHQAPCVTSQGGDIALDFPQRLPVFPHDIARLLH